MKISQARPYPVPAATAPRTSILSRLVEPPTAGHWGARCGRLGLMVALLALHNAAPAAATDLQYVLMSPNFGGSNASALQMAQTVQSLKAAQAAAQAAASRAATPTDPSQAFVNAIMSQLNGIVAISVAQKLVNTPSNQTSTIQSGNVTLVATNVDGQLTVTITSPTGSTTLTVPSGG